MQKVIEIDSARRRARLQPSGPQMIAGAGKKNGYHPGRARVILSAFANGVGVRTLAVRQEIPERVIEDHIRRALREAAA